MKARYAQEVEFKEIKQRICPNQGATFAKCFNWLMRREELTPGAKLLYSKLAQSAGLKPYARIKQATLAQELGLGLRQVQRYLEELAHFQLIEIKQLGLNKANLYYFLQHPWMIQTDAKEQPQTAVKKEDQENLEVTYMSSPEVSDPTHQEAPDLTCQEMPDPTPPLNRSSEKIPLKENTQKRERKSVCVSPSEVSAYSKEQWHHYALAQKNVHSPKALANELAKSKQNDHFMKEFLESLEQEKKNSSKVALEAQEQALRLEREKYILVKQILALGEPLYPWQVQFVQDNQHLLSNQQAC